MIFNSNLSFFLLFFILAGAISRLHIREINPYSDFCIAGLGNVNV